MSEWVFAVKCAGMVIEGYGIVIEQESVFCVTASKFMLSASLLSPRRSRGARLMYGALYLSQGRAGKESPQLGRS